MDMKELAAVSHSNLLISLESRIELEHKINMDKLKEMYLYLVVN
jgi:hypothetical protein